MYAGHCTDPLPGERAWVRIDGVLIRGYAGWTTDGDYVGRAYVCGLDHGSQNRSQAMLEVPMEASTLRAIGEAILALAELAGRVAERTMVSSPPGELDVQPRSS